jgi:hypothetical protein
MGLIGRSFICKSVRYFIAFFTASFTVSCNMVDDAQGFLNFFVTTFRSQEISTIVLMLDVITS